MQDRPSTGGRNPSSEGVQRDLLPIIEGTTISTKAGDINTTNILFICAGAFSFSKPTDLMPELLGRLPNRISLRSLNRHDFRKILSEVENGLIFQYQQLLSTEGISVEFTADALDMICVMSEEINLTTENIGARRLLSVLEKILEEIGFQGPDNKQKTFVIDTDYIQQEAKNLLAKQDLRRYLL
jgi:ATP-dependent HslUV protease ATP-binding subunit HslU